MEEAVYQDGNNIMEETWQTLPTTVNYVLTKEHGGLREVKMGSQKVAAQPIESDWEKAATWTISNLNELNENLDLYLQIDYQGDVARIYADGILVEDNFWNGKPMLVRLSDLVGKQVELKILPLGKDYPIYLQQEQKAELNKAPNDILISLGGIKVLERKTEFFTSLPLPVQRDEPGLEPHLPHAIAHQKVDDGCDWLDAAHRCGHLPRG